MRDALRLNEQGQVIGWVPGPPLGPFPTTTGVVWEDGEATKIVPGDSSGLGSMPAAISELGVVVGRRLDPFGFVAFPFSWDDGAYTALMPVPDPTMPGPPSPMGLATAVNERGQVLGAKITRGGDLPTTDGRAVVWRDGKITATSDVQALGVDLNNTGSAAVLVRHGDAGETTAGLWRIGGTVTDLGTLGGATSSAVAINEIGQIAGTSRTASGDEHAFVWHRGRMTDLGTLGGAGSRAVAVNEWGQVVGEAQAADGAWHAFLWRDGDMTDIGAAFTPNQSIARDINNRGQVVGMGVNAGAVLWTVEP